jgi:hypothetical protein
VGGGAICVASCRIKWRTSGRNNTVAECRNLSMPIAVCFQLRRGQQPTSSMQRRSSAVPAVTFLMAGAPSLTHSDHVLFCRTVLSPFILLHTWHSPHLLGARAATMHIVPDVHAAMTCTMNPVPTYDETTHRRVHEAPVSAEKLDGPRPGQDLDSQWRTNDLANGSLCASGTPSWRHALCCGRVGGLRLNMG